jgi:hypothetical protein
VYILEPGTIIFLPVMTGVPAAITSMTITDLVRS